MSEVSNTNQSTGEIDLLGLFLKMISAIGKMFSALGRFIMISIVFMIRRWIPLGLSIIVGIVLTYLVKVTSGPVYSSDMVLKTNAIEAADMISYINRLHTYCREENRPALAEALSLDPVSVKKIGDISSHWIIDKNHDKVPDMVDYLDNHDIYDTNNVRMDDRFDILVKVKSPQELPSIRNGLISFINKDSLFQHRNRVRLMQNQEMVSRLDYDIIQLDSLQKIKYFEETKNLQPKTGGQIVFLQEQKTQLVYTDIYDLYKRKQALDAERTLYKDIVTVLSDFAIPAKRDNGLVHYGLIIIPLIFLLTVIFLILRTNRKKIRKAFEKY
jgi:hypothetical protein